MSPAAADFASWKNDFRRRALAAGISPGTFDTAFAGVGVNREVLRLDRHQPEFVRPIWEYLDTAVSDTRIANGREKVARHGPLMQQIEERYGVDMGAVVAIWGIESAYGQNYGSIPVVESLATLAFDGRRRDWAEEQLVAALRIVENGDIASDRMVGSWAGAMGHTQFIPTSFRDYAVDYTGDGRRDVWSSNPADALASTANYLARFGWERGAPTIVEVTLPQGFDYTQAAGSNRRSAAEWAAAGVRPVSGGSLPAGEGVEILVPAGSQGPAFAAYPNFRVIKRYNTATSYAMAVSLLGSRLDPEMGAGPIVADWPRGDKPLSRTETIELQKRLTALGYPTDGVDGIIGPNTRQAVRAFQSARGMVPDGYVSTELLRRVRAAGS